MPRPLGRRRKCNWSEIVKGTHPKEPEAYSKPCQTSKMGLIGEIVKGWRLLAIFAKRFILDVSQGTECASGILCKLEIRKLYYFWRLSFN